ncbi:MAG: hypothetical protein WDZ35_11265 [Crocinitomicaceae bacterium]
MPDENKVEENDLNFLRKNSVNGWVPKHLVQPFLNLKGTAMSEFPKKHNVRTSRLGKRIFYYLPDIEERLDKNGGI